MVNAFKQREGRQQGSPSLQINRTDRPLAYDLADAYNSRPGHNPDLKWIVVGAQGDEQVRLVPAQEARRNSPLTLAQIAGMSDDLIKIGLSCGALVQAEDGTILPAD